MTARYNRFTDPTPFTPLSQLSPEAREWHLKVMAAKQRFARTDDPTELIELGVFPKDYSERRAGERDTVTQAEAAEKEVSVELDKGTIDEINRRIALGHTYARIHRELDLDYWTVHRHAKAGWLSTKREITYRLNKLSRENDPVERAKLVKEVSDRVTYLFEGGKALGKTIDRIEKTISG